MDRRQAFDLAILAQLYAIDGICQRWGLPQFQATLILRDPDHPQHSIVFGPRDLDGVLETMRVLQQYGLEEGH